MTLFVIVSAIVLFSVFFDSTEAFWQKLWQNREEFFDC